jgi:large subunit ribosomal protein L19
MDKLKLAEQTIIDDEYPEFKTGDTVNVHYRVREGDKERIQKFEGVVISRRGSGANQTFMVRKISAGNIGVERIFPLFSPFIAKIELKKQGDIKRSKLYYLRERQGKSARVKEKDQNQDQVRELNKKAEAKTAEEDEEATSEEE